MTKKQMTSYIAEDIVKIIDNYKDKYNLKNRSVAIERIILEWEMMKTMPITIGSTTNNETINPIPTREEIRKSEEEIRRDMFEEALNDAFDTKLP